MLFPFVEVEALGRPAAAARKQWSGSEQTPAWLYFLTVSEFWKHTFTSALN